MRRSGLVGNGGSGGRVVHPAHAQQGAHLGSYVGSRHSLRRHDDGHILFHGIRPAQIADRTGCELDAGIVQTVREFWSIEEEKCTTVAGSSTLQVESGASSKTPGILGSLLKVFLKIKADLKYNEEVRREYRKKIRARSSEWMELLRRVSDEIISTMEGKARSLFLKIWTN